MRGLAKWVKGLTPYGWGASAVTLVVLAVLAYFVLHRLFFQPAQLAEARGKTIVVEEQGKAEGRIFDDTMASVREREVYREHVTTVVKEGRNEVDQAWNGETVGEGVDAAGASALCGLHDSLCRPGSAASVQPVR